MNTSPRHPRIEKTSAARNGAIGVLMAFLLPVLLILVSICINIAYMQLTRTELMVATDAAARAGGRAMSVFQDVDEAKTAAQVTAALNNVAGMPLRLQELDEKNEIEFGDSEPNEQTDRFVFEKVETAEIIAGTNDATSIRITGLMNENSLTGRLHALFPTFGMVDEFDLHAQAVAMQVDRDIAMILDRSGSMGNPPVFPWPQGFNPFSSSALDAGVDAGLLYTKKGRYYYSNGVDQTAYFSWLWQYHLGLGTPPKTPWEELCHAVDVFLTVLEATDQDEQVSLASYSTHATLDLTLVKDYDRIRAKLEDLSPGGNTAIGEGMQEGIPSLLDASARPFAAKTLLVMTDGIHNSGINPTTVAQQIVSQYDVTIHTVTFGAGADQNLMQQVAEIGGGEHYHAANGDELNDIFEEIANNLPTIVTQ